MRRTTGWTADLVMAPGAFRVLLATTVFVNHFYLPSDPEILSLGPAAVYLFFVLSGFWVFTIWDRDYAVTDHPWLVFVLSRAWRLLPVYLCALALSVVSVAEIEGRPIALPAPESWAALHFYASNLLILGQASLPTEAALIPQAWSLDLEMQFYLLAPVLIRILKGTELRSWRRMILYGCAVAGLFWLLVVPAQPGDRPPHALPMYLGFFLIGMLAARHRWRPRPALASLLAGLACLQSP